MYEIQETSFGYDLTFGGFMDAEEMTAWKAESARVLEDSPDTFGVFVDMRDLNPLPEDAQEIMEEGQAQYKQSGMERSVVILDSMTTTLQFKRIAKESGIYDWERYINASAEPNWREVGLAWIEDGVDPDA